jgi:hypothetical protein
MASPTKGHFFIYLPTKGKNEIELGYKVSGYGNLFLA